MAENDCELYLDDINITSENINFDEIDIDLSAFQEDEQVQQALQRGVDLKKYGRELEKELKIAENELVAQHVDNNQQVIVLHKQMQECDAVLARMQDMLLGFQTDLGGISEEIKHLQDESLSMSIKLKNRRAAEEKLHKFIDSSSLSPDLSSAIMSSAVNDHFLTAVVALNNKLKYLQQNNVAADGSSLDITPAETFTGRTLLPELEKLKIKAISRIRDYFVSQFNALRKPKTNVHMLQQTSLIKYAPLLQFVAQETPSVAEDLRTLYVESMGRTILNVFKCYYSQLSKLDLVLASKQDLIVIEEASLKSVFTQKVNLSKRLDIFNLSDRDKILDQVDCEPILLHVAIAENQKYPYETLLRSVVKHLSDAATNEFLFIADFFRTSPRETFNRIFGKTLSLVLESLENYLLSCYDAIGLLLMIKVTHAQRLMMQRRRIPNLDAFFDRISILMWPRFKQVLDANIKSLKNANPKRLGAVDLTPHFVSRRYAEFVASLLSLQTGGDTLGIGGGGENMLQYDLQILRTEMINLLERLSHQLVSTKDRKVFLINNYDQILGVLQERRSTGEEVQKFEDLMMRQRELFAEEEIKTSFSRLISFVIQTEQAMAEFAATHASAPGVRSGSLGTGVVLDEGIVEGLVREFSSGWRTGVQLINDDVITYFANFRSGTDILKQVLTQLLLYYTRFQDIIKKSWPRTSAPPFARDIVSTATILLEIKKFSRTF